MELFSLLVTLKMIFYYFLPQYSIAKCFVTSKFSLRNYFEKLPKVGILAVDEAHCISQWGHSFRTSFRNLGRVREDLGYPVCLAATATATARVRDDTIKNLR